MAQLMKVARLTRLTLVRKKSGSTAKHPDLRQGVVETTKATPATKSTPGESTALRRWRTSWQ